MHAYSGLFDVDLHRVRYRYKVGRKQYESVKFGHQEVWTVDLCYLERMHRKYAKGNVVTAYHDPRNPTKVVLVKQAPKGSYWRKLVAFGFLLLVAMGVVGIGFFNLYTKD